MTGSMPGIAASTSETWLFGSPPNAVEAPENSFDFDVTWAWTSMPITTSQSPVAPLMSLWVADALMVSSSGQDGSGWIGLRAMHQVRQAEGMGCPGRNSACESARTHYGEGLTVARAVHYKVHKRGRKNVSGAVVGGCGRHACIVFDTL